MERKVERWRKDRKSTEGEKGTVVSLCVNVLIERDESVERETMKMQSHCTPFIQPLPSLSLPLLFSVLSVGWRLHSHFSSMLPHFASFWLWLWCLLISVKKLQRTIFSRFCSGSGGNIRQIIAIYSSCELLDSLDSVMATWTRAVPLGVSGC